MGIGPGRYFEHGLPAVGSRFTFSKILASNCLIFSEHPAPSVRRIIRRHQQHRRSCRKPSNCCGHAPGGARVNAAPRRMHQGWEEFVTTSANGVTIVIPHNPFSACTRQPDNRHRLHTQAEQGRDPVHLIAHTWALCLDFKYSLIYQRGSKMIINQPINKKIIKSKHPKEHPCLNAKIFTRS